jgi:hypothetical protein
MDKSLHIWVGSASLGDSNWHIDVGILEVFLLLVIDMRSNDVHDSVLVSDHVSEIGLACEVIQLNISLVSKISSGLNFLKLPVP